MGMQFIFITSVQRKNNFAEVLKNLGKYRPENNFVEFIKIIM